MNTSKKLILSIAVLTIIATPLAAQAQVNPLLNSILKGIVDGLTPQVYPVGQPAPYNPVGQPAPYNPVGQPAPYNPATQQFYLNLLNPHDVYGYYQQANVNGQNFIGIARDFITEYYPIFNDGSIGVEFTTGDDRIGFVWKQYGYSGAVSHVWHRVKGQYADRIIPAKGSCGLSTDGIIISCNAITEIGGTLSFQFQKVPTRN